EDRATEAAGEINGVRSISDPICRLRGAHAAVAVGAARRVGLVVVHLDYLPHHAVGRKLDPENPPVLADAPRVLPYIALEAAHVRHAPGWAENLAHLVRRGVVRHDALDVRVV